MSDRVEEVLAAVLADAIAGRRAQVEMSLATRGDLTAEERREVESIIELLLPLEPTRANGQSAQSQAAQVRSEPRSSASTASALPTEELIGHYRLIRELGRGAQSVVYLAVDTRLGRAVALKLLHGAGFSDIGAAARNIQQSRLRREAALASRLEHPGICAVYDVGEWSGSPFLVVRYVEGETLASKIARARSDGAMLVLSGDNGGSAPMPVAGAHSAARHRAVIEIVELIERVARALHVAHVATVIHRDIKPANIMVTPKGDPVIVDFGLAREIQGDVSQLTVADSLVGSPAYMSPEQVELNADEIDHRSDIYSLGVVLYEALTLKRPIERSNAPALFKAIPTAPVLSPRKYNADVSRELAIVIETALEKDRARRYSSALAFAEDLRRVREFEPIHARPVELRVKALRWLQRNPWRAIAALVVVASAIGITWIAELNDQSRTRRAIAEQVKVAWNYLKNGAAHDAIQFDAFRRVVAELNRLDSNDAEVRVLEKCRTQINGSIDTARTLQRAESLIAYAIARQPKLRAWIERRFPARWAELELTLRRPDPLSTLDSIDARLEAARNDIETALQSDAADQGVEDAFEYLRICSMGLTALAVESTSSASSPSAPFGRVHVSVDPPDASVFLFRYEPLSNVANIADDRLIPVPVDAGARIISSSLSLASTGSDDVVRFAPGDAALEVTGVRAWSPAARADLSPGDLIVRVGAHAACEGVVAFADAQVADANGRSPRAFDRVTRVGHRSNPDEFDLEWQVYCLQHSESPGASEWTSDLECDVGDARISIAASRSELESFGSVAEALERRLPAEGVVLTVLSHGALREVRLDGPGESGLSLASTRAPLLATDRNRLDASRSGSIDVPAGSYLLLVRREGFEDQRAPVRVYESKIANRRVSLFRNGTSPEGMIYVAGGPCWLGDGAPRVGMDADRERWVDGYWIGRNEVTAAQYKAFLDAASTRSALDDGRRDFTFLLMPRVSVADTPYHPMCAPIWLQNDGTYENLGKLERPILDITCEDMDAYCRWLTGESEAAGGGWLFRLPTSDEWEKSARGVDGRTYPWGETLDARYFKCADSRRDIDPGVKLIEPVGRFSIDESPFGIHDCGGGAHEYCSGRGTHDAPFMRVYRGGYWQLSIRDASADVRCAARHEGWPFRPGANDGFRIAAWPKSQDVLTRIASVR